MASHKCSIYTRTAGSRAYERAYPSVTYPTGTTFCLRFKDSTGKRVWATLSATSYPEALMAAVAKQLELFQRDGRNYDTRTPITKLKPVPAFVEAVAPEEVAKPRKGKTPLDVAIENYNRNVATRSGKTVSAYAYTMKQFYTASQAKVRYVEDVNKQTLIDFVAYLRTTGAGNRTIHNRVSEIGTFLRAAGLDLTEVTKMVRGAQVKFTGKAVSAYSEDEVRQFFRACNPEDRLLFEFFLGTGCREQEVMHACYADIDYRRRIYTVRDKPAWDFVTKDHSERPIPIPASLVQALQERRRLHPDDQLIFPKPSGGPDGHFLRRLKRIVKNAGIPGHWELHKWRKSFASFHHEQGVSARTLQMWLGHSDLETTESYLQASDMRSKKIQNAVDNSFAAFG